MRVLWRHAAVDVVRRLAIEVIADVRVEIVERVSLHTISEPVLRQPATHPV